MRTVAYMRDLLSKIDTLESDLAAAQAAAHAAPSALCRDCGTQTPLDTSAALPTGSRKRKRAGVDSPPSLPSIASLLNPQLPSPPGSVPIRPMQDADPLVLAPPALTLPSPSQLAARPPGMRVPLQSPTASHSSGSWTSDEEHVASLLLRISTKRNGAETTEGDFSQSVTPGLILGLRSLR